MAGKKKPEAPAEATEAFIYLGPSIRGVIQYATIYKGTRTEVMEFLDLAISAYPDIAKLIVPADKISEVKNELNSGAGSYSRAYRALLKIN